MEKACKTCLSVVALFNYVMTNIMNGIVELQSIPVVLKRGILVPVYKGSGRDPLIMDAMKVLFSSQF